MSSEIRESRMRHTFTPKTPLRPTAETSRCPAVIARLRRLSEETMRIDTDLLLVFAGNELGDGPGDLGEKLTELYLKSLARTEMRPGKIIFLNSAIFLTTEGSPVLDSLVALERDGTEITSCITCLTYHDRMERVVVGDRSDMKATVEAMTTAARVVTL
jgi:hypothetical protein